MTEPLAFFTTDEASTFEAIAARLWPGTPEDPGAREVGVLVYVDRALAGAYAHLQDAYRRGLAAVDNAAQGRFARTFVRLTEGDQDALLADIEQGTTPEFASPSASEFFTMCLTHTMEGVFSDPIHGGNRDFGGWRVVGYPGPTYGYSAEEQMQQEPLRRPFRSIADLTE